MRFEVSLNVIPVNYEPVFQPLKSKVYGEEMDEARINVSALCAL
jgi:hypothetical protein